MMTMPSWVPGQETKPAPMPLLLVQSFVNTWDGTHGGTVMTAILPISDHLSRLTGLFVTVKLDLLVTNRRLAVLRAA